MGPKILKSSLPAFKSNFLKSDSAVSVAIGAAMLLAIGVIFITTIQVYHVPQWIEDAEYAHMSEVLEDMSRFKCEMDFLSTGMEVNPDARILLNSPLRMGGGYIPVIKRMKSGGTLSFDPEGCRMSVNVLANVTYTGNLTNESCSRTLDCGAISYKSENSYYLDQLFCYENGALIVVQDDLSFLKLSPGITLNKTSDTTNLTSGTAPNILNLNINAISIDSSSFVLSSNSLEDIRMLSGSRKTLYNIKGRESFYNINSVSLTIFTDYPKAWEAYFNDIANEANCQNTDYTCASNSSAVVFSLHPDEKLEVNIYESVIKVDPMSR